MIPLNNRGRSDKLDNTSNIPPRRRQPIHKHPANIAPQGISEAIQSGRAQLKAEIERFNEA